MYRNLVDNGFFIVSNFFSNYSIARSAQFILLFRDYEEKSVNKILL